MRLRWALGLLLGFLLLGAVAFLVLAWYPAIPTGEPPAAFEPALIVRGAQLALIGNCNTCHTKPEGAPYAGGRPMTTPFGTIYATNITPDPDTGIGRWSETACVW